MSKLLAIAIASLGVTALAGHASAEPRTQPRTATSALLYSYDVIDGDKFNEGYRAHLGWHAEKHDLLAWYGWYVTSGARVGTFVDGTFGAPLAEIDRRPDLAGDGAHFQQHVKPYARATNQTVHALWPEVSTTFTLEDRRPSVQLDVIQLRVAPEAVQRFEARLTALAAKRGKAATGTGWTWYRALLGADLPGYLVLIPRADWAALDPQRANLARMAMAAYGVPETAAADLARDVVSIGVESWSYRADLSYLPE